MASICCLVHGDLGVFSLLSIRRRAKEPFFRLLTLERLALEIAPFGVYFARNIIRGSTDVVGVGVHSQLSLGGPPRRRAFGVVVCLLVRF